MTDKKLAAALKPKRLGPRGKALWLALTEDEEPDASRALLISEACRMADRLDRLNAILSGDVDVWARIPLPKYETELVLKIDSAATEARQTTSALRQVLNQLTAASSGAGSTPDQGGNFLDYIATRAADRIAEAAAQ